MARVTNQKAVPPVLARFRVPFLALVVLLAALTLGATSASAAIVINEVESDDPAAGPDWIELKNTGASTVDIGGYVLKDSNDANSYTIPAATMVAAGAYYTVDQNTFVFGLGSGDSARLFDNAASLLDSYSWVSHAAATYGRCPDGIGNFTSTTSATLGATNDCPVVASPWPGGSTVTAADEAGVLGGNVSGLAYQPSGTSARGVLWAVRNNPAMLYRLVYNGTTWVNDTANGWGSGKQLFFTNGSGVPDAEGVTLAGGDANGIFVSIERNDDGANSNTSRPAVLRYDVSSPAATLTATREWNLTADIPGLGANLGLEAIGWVPDSLLTAKGFVDESTGLAYNPASYADHGSGIFFVGVEQDGRVIGYALNQANGSFTRVATIASGFPKIMDLEYEPESTHFWAVCDDSCNGKTATLDIAQSGPNMGKFVVTNTYARPSAADDLNNEGFAIAPQAECVNNLKPTFYADDSNTNSHAIRTGTINCTVLPGGGDGGGGGGGGSTPPPPGPGPGEIGVPFVLKDVTAPTLGLSLKFAKKGTFAVRKTGKFGAKVTLDEPATLVITVTAKKNKRAKSRTIVKTTRKNIAKGTRTFTFTLSKKVRKTMSKGTIVTLKVKATDGAGNSRTKSATTKVP